MTSMDMKPKRSYLSVCNKYILILCLALLLTLYFMYFSRQQRGLLFRFLADDFVHCYNRRPVFNYYHSWSRGGADAS